MPPHGTCVCTHAQTDGQIENKVPPVDHGMDDGDIKYKTKKKRYNVNVE